MKKKRGSVAFEPKARIIKLLGDELIPNEVIAVFELVKNAYDADAKKVEIFLNDITSKENGAIKIRDTGVGMTLDTVLNDWMQPGTDVRKKSRDRNERSKIFNRPILGEKGVGRFSAQKLGTKINISTKHESDEYENIIEIDWKKFEDNKLLSEVKVEYLQIDPTEFRDGETGTLIEIDFLRKAWDKRMVLDLVKKIQTIKSPFTVEENFEIKVISDDYSAEIKELEFSIDVFERAVYKFNGSVSKKGVLKANYVFLNPAFLINSREEEIINKDIRSIEYFIKNKKALEELNVGNIKKDDALREPTCGYFDFSFYVWDLDSRTLKETITRPTYNKLVKHHTGVKLYRDNFRIWPYGTEGNDWLKLDKRRLNNMPKCFSNNQIVGIISVSYENNKILIDKTDRQGLIENDGFLDLLEMILLTINEFEILRRQDKTIIDNLRERKVGRRFDETLEEIDKFKKVLNKNNHYDKYIPNVNSIEKAYIFYKENIVDRLFVIAGLGISALMPAHEVQHQLKYLKPKIETLETNMKNLGFGGVLIEQFVNIYDTLQVIEDVADGALSLSRKNYREFSLKSAVEFSIQIKEQELKRNNIHYIINEKMAIKIKGYSNFIITAILNLIDNSIWWLNKQFEEQRILKITIKTNDDKNPIIICSDNGPGIDPSDLPYLGDAFYTRKPNGTGLGLYISNRLMAANDGTIEYGFYPNDKDYLKGANVILVFKKGVK